MRNERTRSQRNTGKKPRKKSRKKEANCSAKGRDEGREKDGEGETGERGRERASVTVKKLIAIKYE